VSSEARPRRLVAGHVVVAGVGNILLGDEGVGVHAVRALEAGAATLPGDVTLVDAGTSLLDVLPLCRDAAMLVVIDAVRAGRTPGTVYRLPIDLRSVSAEASQVSGAGGTWSLHDWTVFDALSAGARLGLAPVRVVLIGVEPASVEPGTALSPQVERAMGRLLRAVAHAVNERGSRRRARCPKRDRRPGLQPRRDEGAVGLPGVPRGLKPPGSSKTRRPRAPWGFPGG
jgi:hydrogenase maturation protease